MEKHLATSPSSTPAPKPPPAGTDRLLYEVERLQRELDTLGRELAWSHRLATLGTLAAAAAHEVNNILTPVCSYAQLALADPSDTRMTAKALEVAVENAHRASRIFAATLGYARDDRGQGGAALSQPGEVFALTLDCLPRQPERDGIVLAAEFDDATLAIHPTELQQVLLNLLLNARKALLAVDKVSPQIDVLGQRTADDGRYQLTIRDNGPGIPADARDHLFEPFVTRAPDATAASSAQAPCDAKLPADLTANSFDLEDVKGTGLGLAVCRRLIEAAGGTIGVDSTPGGGATFTIDLPTAAQHGN